MNGIVKMSDTLEYHRWYAGSANLVVTYDVLTEHNSPWNMGVGLRKII